jgi:hypothetical protein
MTNSLEARAFPTCQQEIEPVELTLCVLRN